MTDSLSSPAMVLAVVLAESVAGGAAVLWAVPLWGRVRTGFFKLTGGVIAVSAVLAWLAARAPLTGQGAPVEAKRALWMLAATAIVAVLWQVLVWAGARDASRWAGIAVVPFAVAALLALAAIPAPRNGMALRAFQLLAGAVFAGAAMDGLLLGHWHLVDRKLSNEPLRRVNLAFLGAAPFVALAVLLGGTGGGTARPDFSPLLGVGTLTVALAVGLVALCVLMGFFIRALVREGSLQAATGFFYLSVIMGFSAEFAAKVRFF